MHRSVCVCALTCVCLCLLPPRRIAKIILNRANQKRTKHNERGATEPPKQTKYRVNLNQTACLYRLISHLLRRVVGVEVDSAALCRFCVAYSRTHFIYSIFVVVINAFKRPLLLMLVYIYYFFCYSVALAAAWSCCTLLLFCCCCCRLWAQVQNCKWRLIAGFATFLCSLKGSYC